MALRPGAHVGPLSPATFPSSSSWHEVPTCPSRIQSSGCFPLRGRRPQKQGLQQTPKANSASLCTRLSPQAGSKVISWPESCGGRSQAELFHAQLQSRGSERCLFKTRNPKGE